MRSFSSFCLIFLCLASTPLWASLDKQKICHDQVIDVPIHECEALLDIHNALLDSRHHWQRVPISSWRSVSVENGHVTIIDLRQGWAVGQIPESIGDLRELRQFGLIGRNVFGQIPESIGQLEKLEELNLQLNNLSGSLPEAIAKLSNLRELSLSNNRFSGKIPSSWAGLESLVKLNLFDNNLSGEIPAGLMAGMDVREILLGLNNFSGTIPPWFFGGNESKILNLKNNNFGGPLPSTLTQLKSGSYVYLSDNKISGSLPANIQSLSLNNVQLWLDNNQLSGSIPAYSDPGPIIDHKSGLLSLSGNNLSGSIPEYFFSTYVDINLSDNKLEGSLPSDFANIGKDSQARVDLSRNRLTGSIPALKSTGEVIEFIDLSYNSLSGDFSGVLSDDEYLVKKIDLSYNKFSGVYSSLRFSGIGDIDLSHNQLSGNLNEIYISDRHGYPNVNISHNNFKSDNLRLTGGPPYNFSIAHNRLEGEVPNFNDWCEWRNGSSPIELWDFSHNKLVGTLDKDQFYNCEALHFDVTHNRLHGGLADIEKFLKDKWRSDLSFDYQTPYRVIDLSEGSIELLLGTESKKHVYQVTVPNGKKLDSISGCTGRVEGSIVTLQADQYACDLTINFVTCNSPSACLVDYGSTGGVRNARIESPSANKTISGVLQFRGWLHEDDIRKYKSYSHRTPRTAKFLIDGSEINLEVNFNRFDVASTMGYKQEDQPLVGWSALFYVGNLENGRHTATLMTNEGVVADTVVFNSFSLKNADGNPAYISNSKRELVVEDFPYIGSDLIARFNSSEQSFSIIDQLDKEGKSTRSELIHYSEDGLQPKNSGLINDVAQIMIEAPNSDRNLLGVASMRGWAYGNDLLNGLLYMSLDDGEPFLLPRGERSDVEQAMNVNTSVKVGWSQLFYAGNLENGHHRLRLYGDQQGQKVLVAQGFFESFVPLDETGKTSYIQASKTIELSDFPFEGSQIELKFDVSGQNFIPVRQVVD